jgi:VIT1/CCC1 family predicted Fe2+/Mn2+ transporter
MAQGSRAPERHRSARVKWLRAAVLGADDAIVSTASLMIGVAASAASRQSILLAGVAGLVAGAMSMAAGEYVSVSSQRDSELADIAVEKEELATEPKAELEELTKIYMRRGLDPELARRVAKALSRHDVLAAHLRDELGIEPDALSAPILAAVTSAMSFALSALVPIGGFLVAPEPLRVPIIALVSLLSLGALGALGGYLGGAPVLRAALRVTLGGALAMAATAGIGRLFGVATG